MMLNAECRMPKAKLRFSMIALAIALCFGISSATYIIQTEDIQPIQNSSIYLPYYINSTFGTVNNCTLYVNSINSGNTTSIVSNMSLNYSYTTAISGQYNWYLNCTDAIRRNVSVIRNFTSIVQLENNTGLSGTISYLQVIYPPIIDVIPIIVALSISIALMGALVPSGIAVGAFAGVLTASYLGSSAFTYIFLMVMLVGGLGIAAFLATKTR